MDRTHRWLAASVALAGVSLGLLVVRQAPDGVRIPTTAAVALPSLERPTRGPQSLVGPVVVTVLPTTTAAPTTTAPAATTTVAPAPQRASRSAPTTSNQDIGRRLMLERWGEDQWPCLRDLWDRESGWRETAQNPSSGAYGIPQAYSGTKYPFNDRGIKMSSHGADWRTNPETQIRWGLDYIGAKFGTPCKADQVQQHTGSY